MNIIKVYYRHVGNDHKEIQLMCGIKAIALTLEKLNSWMGVLYSIADQ